VSRSLTVNVESDFDLVLAGDLHTGSVFFNEDGVKSMVDDIQNAQVPTYCILMGDYIEGHPTSHDHHEFELLDIQKPLDQLEHATSLLEPIQDNILGILRGNHDKMVLDTVSPIRDRMCHDLESPYLSGQHFVMMKTPNGGVGAHVQHKGRRIPKSSNSDAKKHGGRYYTIMRRFSEPQDQAASASIVATGHTHESAVFGPPDRSKHKLLDDEVEEEMTWVEHGASTSEQHDGRHRFVDPCERWYAKSGTFRDTTMVPDELPAHAVDDYSLDMGVSAQPSAYTKFSVRSGEVLSGEVVYPQTEH
jgi:predicted phosphodiesterase